MNRLAKVLQVGICLFFVTGCIMGKRIEFIHFPDPSVRFNFMIDSTQNKTIMTIFPYGDMKIPGEWNHVNYLSSLHQNFFKNMDSTCIGIAKNPTRRYPFYDVKFSNKDLLVEYYKWDVLYWQNKGLETRVFRNWLDSGYVIWMARDPQTMEYSVLLYGIKDSFAYNLSIASSIWSDEQMANFLEEVYQNN